MTNVFNFKATKPFVWALIAAIGAALFLYAGHSTIAARFTSGGPVGAESSALRHTPAVTGHETPVTLYW
jgi:hypothetical protein